VAGSFEHGNAPLGSTKDGFLDQLSSYQFLKEDSAPWSQLLICGQL
jgi:hypothetical protein